MGTALPGTPVDMTHEDLPPGERRATTDQPLNAERPRPAVTPLLATIGFVVVVVVVIALTMLL